MIISFFGHSKFSGNVAYEQLLLDFLEKNIGDKTAVAYLGDHGDFDTFAYDCCKKYKLNHPNFTLVYVTPYMTLEFQKGNLNQQLERYDEILYPEIEDKPIRFAIVYRNRYMVEKSDYVVTFVSHNWGGAYAAYKYAERKGKPIFNLADFKE